MQFDMLWTLDRLRSSGMDLRYVTTQTVDRIVWHFYYVPGETLHDLMLWCVPAHEEIALGMYCGRFMTEFSGIDAGTIGVDYLDFSPEELENLADDVARIILYRLDPMPDVDTLTDVTLVPPIMEQYAQILPNYESSYEYNVQPLSSTGRSAQFILDGKTYRISTYYFDNEENYYQVYAEFTCDNELAEKEMLEISDGMMGNRYNTELLPGGNLTILEEDEAKKYE